MVRGGLGVRGLTFSARDAGQAFFAKNLLESTIRVLLYHQRAVVPLEKGERPPWVTVCAGILGTRRILCCATIGSGLSGQGK